MFRYSEEIQTKFNAFYENAGLLNEHLNITPLMYGSLAVADIVHRNNITVDDIDVLIPEAYLTGEGWQRFCHVLATHGYVLTDEHEHTFVKDGVSYAYASIEDLLPFAGIDPSTFSSLHEYSCDGYTYCRLLPDEMLRVYEKSSQDGYRVGTRPKKDAEKIQLLSDYIATDDLF